MPHFILKPLLSATLITVGIWLLIWSWSTLAVIPDPLRHFTLWLAASMLIGVGVMIPFNRAQLGAIVGGLLFLLTMLLLLIGTAIYNW
jgi:hypothetical protein